jgi:GntR family transcriptional regulator/MocR family aminotransferase
MLPVPCLKRFCILRPKITAGSIVLAKQTPRPPNLSERGSLITQIPFVEKSLPRAFCPSLPAVDAFPFKLWKKLWLESWRELTAEQLGYGAALGYWPLREAIATYLQAARGLRCTAEQVIITNGAQQALSLSALLLLNKGDQAWVENPSFNGIKAVLRSASARIVPISVDEDGLVVGEALARAPRARLVFISPSHQFPLGVTMSLTRRLKLLQWAQESDAWILEDDYDSEFRYAAYPLTALQGLDTRGRVIYIGTFSKVLFPALRIGYMVVPSGLIEAFRAARAHADRGSTLLEQLVLARFVAEGHLARHIRRMRSLYAKRQAVFVEAVQTHLQGWLDVQPNDTGLHLVAWLPEGLTINTFHESYWKTVSTSLRFHHMR